MTILLVRDEVISTIRPTLSATEYLVIEKHNNYFGLARNSNTGPYDLQPNIQRQNQRTDKYIL